MYPIANMFTIIRNGYAVKKETVVVPYSKIKSKILESLRDNGYIKDFIVRGKKIKKSLEVALLYKENEPAIEKIRRISKPSKRIYISFRESFPIRGGRGIRILSTSSGILTDKEAREKKVGGEVIGEIY